MSNRLYRPNPVSPGNKLSHPKQETQREQRIRRREEANVRALMRAERTPQIQLEELDIALGKGVGAKKERARLLKMIESK